MKMPRPPSLPAPSIPPPPAPGKVTKTAKEHWKVPGPPGPAIPLPYPNVPEGALASAGAGGSMHFGFEFALAGNARGSDEVPLMPTVDLDDAARRGVHEAHGASDGVIDAMPGARVDADVSVNGHHAHYDADTERGRANLRRGRDAAEHAAGAGIDLADHVADHEREGVDTLIGAGRAAAEAPRPDLGDAARRGTHEAHDVGGRAIDALPDASADASVSVNGHGVGAHASTDAAKNVLHGAVDAAETVANAEIGGAEMLADGALGGVGASLEVDASAHVEVNGPDVDPLAAVYGAWDRTQAQATRDVTAAIQIAQQLATTANGMLVGGQEECQQALAHADQAAQAAAAQAQADAARAEAAAKVAHEQMLGAAKASAAAVRDQAKGMLDGARNAAQHAAQQAAQAAQRMFGHAASAGHEALDRAQRDFDNMMKRAHEQEEKMSAQAKEKLAQAREKAEERKHTDEARARKRLHDARRRARRALAAARKRARGLLRRARRMVRDAQQRAMQRFTSLQHRFLALGQEPPAVELPDLPDFAVGAEAGASAGAEASVGDAEIDIGVDVSVEASASVG